MDRRRLLGWLTLGLLCLALVTVRVVASSRGLLREGDDALQRGQLQRAVMTLGRAARMYAPGNPYSRRALGQLNQIAARADAAGDRPLALSAYREARSAILSTRSVYTPHPDLLDRANRRIAALMAAEEAADPELSREPPAAREAWHYAALLRDDMPRTGYVLLAEGGLLLFLFGAVAMTFRGVTPEGRFLGRPMLRFGLLAGAGFLLMLLGLWKA